MAPDPYLAVKRELLVRYLDFWAPAVLHPARPATYLDFSSYGPAAALRVFVEFADLLADRTLTMLVGGEVPPDPDVLGLRIAPAPPDPAGAARHGTVLVLLDDEPPAGSGPSSPTVDLLAVVGGSGRGEALLVTAAAPAGGGPADETRADDVRPDRRPADVRAPLHDAGFTHVAAVELVDASGAAQLLRFATSSARNLARFKEELWAVDEFAGVRYRDPSEPAAVPLDISLEPHLGPLRRALLAHLATAGARTVAQLRDYALAGTLYRPGDVARALGPLLSRGAVTREPDRGRLTATTVVRLAG